MFTNTQIDARKLKKDSRLYCTIRKSILPLPAGFGQLHQRPVVGHFLLLLCPKLPKGICYRVFKAIFDPVAGATGLGGYLVVSN